VEGIRVVTKKFGDVEGLPQPKEGKSYVVSAITAQAAWANGRTDVFSVGDPVRDGEGKIIGCRSLCANPNV
jgi:hypothetical protein